jgi:hypothetical protein
MFLEGMCIFEQIHTSKKAVVLQLFLHFCGRKAFRKNQTNREDSLILNLYYLFSQQIKLYRILLIAICYYYNICIFY